ncbi:MAG: hypothetical protein ACOCVG_00115 [Verrucomicrobiota bacterium]
MSDNTSDRVRQHTSEDVQAHIDAATVENIMRYSSASDRKLKQRLDELEKEWDVERILETNASALALSGVLLSLVHHRRWLLLSGGVLGFLMQHATQGWCPPLPILRRLGVRTRREIDRERTALKALRGDYDDLPIPERKKDEPLTFEQSRDLLNAC